MLSAILTIQIPVRNCFLSQLFPNLIFYLQMHKREIVEAVTVIETLPMTVVSLVGYIETPRGLRNLTTVWASHLSDKPKRRFYKNWYCSKKKAFTRYAKKHAEDGGKSVARELERIRKYCTIVPCPCAHSNPQDWFLAEEGAPYGEPG